MPLRLAKHFYDECLKHPKKPSPPPIIPISKEFESFIGIPYKNLFDATEIAALTPETLGNAIGYLEGRNLNSLLSPAINAGYKREKGKPRMFSLMIRQAETDVMIDASRPYTKITDYVLQKDDVR